MTNKYLKTVLILLIGFNICFAQVDKTIVIGKQDSLYSNIYEADREIFVHVPGEFNFGSFRLNPSKFPVLYVLDPETHFASIVSILDRMSYEGLTPQMIVVGVRVKSEQRTQEMFPIEDEDKFHQFLEHELIPYIDRNYPTASYRLLFGHSLTGLRTIHTAINHPELFDSYIAIDPSLCHQNCSWKTKYDNQINSFELGDNRMFLAMANTMGDLEIEEIKKDTSGLATHMNSMISFSQTMINKNTDTENYAWKYYPNYSHGGVTLRATLDGLENSFSWFKNESIDIIYADESSPEQAFNVFQTHYENISKELGYDYLPPEDKVIYLIQNLYHRISQPKKALPFAEMNVRNYPDSKYSDYSKKLLKDIKDAISEVDKKP